MRVAELPDRRQDLRGIGSSEEEWAFAVAIIRLAHSLGKRTLAEGVEHPSQLAQLKSLACELGQGYLFTRPIPLREVIGLLAVPRQKTPLSSAASNPRHASASRGDIRTCRI